MTTTMQNTQTLINKIQLLPIERIAEVEDFVDFLNTKLNHRKTTATTDKESLDFPVISVGKWPDNLSLRREDMYDDDGR